MLFVCVYVVLGIIFNYYSRTTVKYINQNCKEVYPDTNITTDIPIGKSDTRIKELKYKRAKGLFGHKHIGKTNEYELNQHESSQQWNIRSGAKV